METKKILHIGNLISSHIKKQGINKSHLSKIIEFSGKKRTYRTLLNKLDEANMSIDDIVAFSKALNYDFLKDIPQLKYQNSLSLYNLREHQIEKELQSLNKKMDLLLSHFKSLKK